MKQLVAKLEGVALQVTGLRPECDGQVDMTLGTIETFDQGVRDELKQLIAQIATTRGNLAGRAAEIVAKADGMIPPKKG